MSFIYMCMECIQTNFLHDIYGTNSELQAKHCSQRQIVVKAS